MKMRVSIARALVTEPKLLLMDEPFAALDEITRFKLNNDLLRSGGRCGKTVVFVTHSVFEFGLPVEPHRGDDGAAGPCVRRARGRRGLSARRGIPHLGGIRRLLSPRLGGARRRDGGRRRHERSRPKPTASERRDRALRIVLPIVVLALGIVAWELVVRINDIQPYVLPAPSLVFTTFLSDWKVLSESLLVTLVTTFEGFLLAAVGGVGLAILFNQSRLVEYSLYPYAVILQVTPIVADRAAAADLPAAAGRGAGLRLDRGVLPGARQHHARPAIRSTAISSTCSRSTAPRAGRCCGTSSCRRRCRISSAACDRRRPVADRRGGGGDRGRLGRRGLRARLPHRRIRLPAQHPAHVRGAAAALASPAS